LILIQGQEFHLHKQKDALELLGRITRGATMVDARESDENAGIFFIKR